MDYQKYAPTFAPYTPPPDDQAATGPRASGSKPAVKPPVRPWLPTHEASPYAIASYQSGGIPTLGSSAGGVSEEEAAPTNQWETRYGVRVDMLAALAYIFGPVSALFLLITETNNDYVRFHAYQSALLTTPLILLRILAAILRFPAFLTLPISCALVGAILFMAWRAYRDAAVSNLNRFYVPYIGPIADQWVSEE